MATKDETPVPNEMTISGQPRLRKPLHSAGASCATRTSPAIDSAPIPNPITTDHVLGTDGLVLSQFRSGIGYVDVSVLFAKTPHLVELKVLKSNVTGEAQLSTYMANEGRNQGWLILFDTRSPEKKTAIPDSFCIAGATVNVIVVDVNPIPPSKKRRKGC